MQTIIGIDFDNTIVCYHELFHEIACEQKLISTDFPKNKDKIRDYLRRQNQEEQWTKMQGYVYGQKMAKAQPFPGVATFIQKVLSQKIPLYIISHKTRHPYAGPTYDLHQAAFDWLEQYHFFGLSKEQIFFLETKYDKCQKIGEKQCTHFIDDLPELLLDAHFPNTVKKLLFAPEKITGEHLQLFKSWEEIQTHFFGSTSL